MKVVVVVRDVRRPSRLI